MHALACRLAVRQLPFVGDKVFAVPAALWTAPASATQASKQVNSWVLLTNRQDVSPGHVDAERVAGKDGRRGRAKEGVTRS